MFGRDRDIGCKARPALLGTWHRMRFKTWVYLVRRLTRMPRIALALEVSFSHGIGEMRLPRFFLRGRQGAQPDPLVRQYPQRGVHRAGFTQPRKSITEEGEGQLKLYKFQLSSKQGCLHALVMGSAQVSVTTSPLRGRSDYAMTLRRMSRWRVGCALHTPSMVGSEYIKF